MGGFGAMRNGLKYNETFGQIISLSPALHMFEGPEPHIMGLLGKGKEAWEEVENSDLNPRWLIEHIRGEKPGVYLACGLQDELLPGSRVHRKLLKDAGFRVHYVEDEGNHDWDYWDRHIKLALDWLPLDERVGGLNSGNIKGE
jgi:S-formylglutathione hydrolase FrmB